MTEPRLTTPEEVLTNAFHDAARAIVGAAMGHLQPRSGQVRDYELTYEGAKYDEVHDEGVYAVYSQAVFDPNRRILYRLNNRDVVYTPYHDETGGQVITSVGNPYIGLTIETIHLGPDDMPSHFGNQYALPRLQEAVNDYSLALSGLGPADTPMLSDLADSLEHAVWVDVRGYSLAREAVRHQDRRGGSSKAA